LTPSRSRRLPHRKRESQHRLSIGLNTADWQTQFPTAISESANPSLNAIAFDTVPVVPTPNMTVTFSFAAQIPSRYLTIRLSVWNRRNV